MDDSCNKGRKRTLVLFAAVEDSNIMDINFHIAQDIMSTRNGYECKVIPIMYNMSPANMSEIKTEKREIFHNFTGSVVLLLMVVTGVLI